ncbi:hypothetical protein FPV16_23185 [Methylobacterium sp. W2]|uniref:hypothetical protein n=1 Tax=Methylobacterium sp. W2 TaxID=2598107 RepID=UPI001D0C082C|nr:hypothetical protein [Methylobacterium sp. W2]MCC0809068.1 hypothetical protein [Methylobacterium sp. W2]
MSEFLSERRQMTAGCLDQRRDEMRDLLQQIAGPAGLVKARIRRAAKMLGWSFSRTKDLWYCDPRTRVDRPEILQARATAASATIVPLEVDLERLRSLEDEVAELRHLLASTLRRMEGQASDPAQHLSVGSGEGSSQRAPVQGVRNRALAPALVAGPHHG